jgi:hypothetical protein
MSIETHNLIAAISPDIYCDPSVREEVKSLVAQKGYQEAAKKVVPIKSNLFDLDELILKSPFKKPGQANPTVVYKATYEATANSLEPIYFWMLDAIGLEYDSHEKLVDNFTSSTGSAFFSEMGAKLTRMQEEGMKMIGLANQTVRSVLNIIYDLKDFQIRLGVYNALKSENEAEKNAAMLSLKQIWLDKVDIQKGNSSIKALAVGGANAPNFITLIDAFFAVENEKLEGRDGKPLDLNDKVKRILVQRVKEFKIWLVQSETELRKRYEIEKTYLKSQLNTIKLQARWAKPYLRSARLLEQTASPTSALVNVFNTAIFELSVLGKKFLSPEGEVTKGIMPRSLLNSNTRKYFQVIIVDFLFTSIPEKSGQAYGFRGKAEIKFTAYGLNEQELNVLKEESEKGDIEDIFKVISGITDESLGQLQTDIDEILGNKKSEEKKEEKPSDSNPFSAMFSFLKKEKKPLDLSRGIPPDNDMETGLRSTAILEALARCAKIHASFKGANSMPSI